MRFSCTDVNNSNRPKSDFPTIGEQLRENLNRIQGLNADGDKFMALRSCIVVKNIPATNHNPRRFKVSIPETGIPCKIYSAHDPMVDEVDCRYVPQVLAEHFAKTNNLQWKIAAATVIGDSYIFIAK